MRVVFLSMVTATLLTTAVMSGCASTGNKYAVGTAPIGVDGTFAKQYVKAQSKASDVALLKAIDTPIEIVALYGEWCHDSKREMPVLQRLLDDADNANIKFTPIGISTDKKQPADMVAKYNLRYTPTIVVFADGVEIGRIIERPAVSLGADITNFVEAK